MSYLRLRLAVVVVALLAFAGIDERSRRKRRRRHQPGVRSRRQYASASLTHDFIELFNRGTTPVVLDGMSRPVRERHRHGGARRQLWPAHRTVRDAPARQVPAHPRVLGRQRRGSARDRHHRRDADRDGRGGRQGRARDRNDIVGLQRRLDSVLGQQLGASSTSSATEAQTSSRALPPRPPSVPPRRRPGPEAAARIPTMRTRPTSAALSPPAPRNSATAAFVCGAPQPTDPTGVGAATPASVPAGASTLLTVAVTPGANPPSTGISVTGDLSEIGGSAAQTFYDDGTHGDVAAGNNVFSFGDDCRRRDDPGRKEPAGGDRGRRGAEQLRHDRAHGRRAAGSLDRDQRDPGRRAPLAPQRRDGHHDRHRDRKDRQQLLHPGSDSGRELGYVRGPPGLRRGCGGRRERRRRGQRARPRHRVPRRDATEPHADRADEPGRRRALERQRTAGADGDRHGRPRPAEHGDRGRRERQRRGARRALRSRRGRPRLLREPRRDARPDERPRRDELHVHELRRDLRRRRQRCERDAR